jgi:predicted AAA+ superfamily ATPase
VAYVRTRQGFEVDFIARRRGERPVLVQVSPETEGDATWDRELRALVGAGPAHPHARRFLLTLDASPPARPLPAGITWVPAARWLLEGT